MTRFTCILTALLLAAACTPVQARDWERQVVPEMAYDVEGSNCESITCYGREAALAAHAAGLLPVIIVRDAEDCAELSRSGQTLSCQVGKRYLMSADVSKNLEIKADGTIGDGPWRCNSLRCFGWAAINMAYYAGQLPYTRLAGISLLVFAGLGLVGIEFAVGQAGTYCSFTNGGGFTP